MFPGYCPWYIFADRPFCGEEQGGRTNPYWQAWRASKTLWLYSAPQILDNIQGITYVIT